MSFNLAGLGTPESEFALLSAPSGGLCAALSDVRALLSRHGVSGSTLDECIGSIALQDKNAVDLAEFSELLGLLRLLASVQAEECQPELRPMTQAEKDSYSRTFDTADKDRDGLVSAQDVHAIFVASGLGKAVLNHIWSLADANRTRRLDCQACCVALHLLESARRGAALPTQLAAQACLPVQAPAAAPAAQFSGDSTEGSSSSCGSQESSVSSSPAVGALSEESAMQDELDEFFDGERPSPPTAQHSLGSCAGLLEEQAQLTECKAQLLCMDETLGSLCFIASHEVRLGGAGSSELAELTAQLEREEALTAAAGAHGASSRAHLEALGELGRTSEAHLHQMHQAVSRHQLALEQHGGVLSRSTKQLGELRTQLEQAGRGLFLMAEKLNQGHASGAELAQGAATANKLASACAAAGAQASSGVEELQELLGELGSVGKCVGGQREELGTLRRGGQQLEAEVQRTQDKAVAATDDVRMIQTQLKLIQLQQADLLHRQRAVLTQQLACLEQQRAAEQQQLLHRVAATGRVLQGAEHGAAPELAAQPVALVSELLSTMQAMESARGQAHAPLPPQGAPGPGELYGDARGLRSSISSHRRQPAHQEAYQRLKTDLEALRSKLLEWAVAHIPGAKPEQLTGLAAPSGHQRGHHRRGSSITSDLEHDTTHRA